ncbi:MAG: adenylate kinase [Candidatus Syntropharchaeia archaeon]
MMIIVLTGIPGVGSSTVLKGALKEKSNFISVNYGDVMFEIAREKGLVRERDEIRKLPAEIQKEIQKSAAKKISEMEGNIIVDTHCTIRTPSGYLPGLPEWVLRELKPDQFVIVEANPKEIFDRRYKDKSRKRDIQSEAEIDEHQKMNRAMGMTYACLTGAPVKIIENHDKGLEKAIEELKKLL